MVFDPKERVTSSDESDNNFPISLIDFLGIIQFVGTNPDWLGFSHEGYVFAAAVFWVFCYAMSWYSQRLEKKLDTGR